jgi:hypothetical protein
MFVHTIHDDDEPAPLFSDEFQQADEFALKVKIAEQALFHRFVGI